MPQLRASWTSTNGLQLLRDDADAGACALAGEAVGGVARRRPAAAGSGTPAAAGSAPPTLICGGASAVGPARGPAARAGGAATGGVDHRCGGARRAPPCAVKRTVSAERLTCAAELQARGASSAAGAMPSDAQARARPRHATGPPDLPCATAIRRRIVATVALGLAFEEADDPLAQVVVVRVLQHLGAVAGPREGTSSISPSRASGPLVIMATRSDRNSASSTSWVTMSAVFAVAVDQRSSQRPAAARARERVEHAEGLVQQQHLGREGEGARDAHALPHARRRAPPAACPGPRQAHRGRGSAPRSPRARRGSFSRRPGRRPGCTFSSAVSQGSRQGDWKTTPRSGPGP